MRKRPTKEADPLATAATSSGVIVRGSQDLLAGFLGASVFLKRNIHPLHNPVKEIIMHASEKLVRYGVDTLSESELLSLIGLDPKGHSLAALCAMPLEELKGLMDDAERFFATVELVKRGLNQGLGLPSIAAPSEAVPYLADIADKRKEHFVCLYLNARNQLKYKEIVSIGSLSASIVHPREVFLPAVERSAASVILAHNHPSGNVDPSRDDLELTKRLIEAGQLLGIEVLDHLIVSSSDVLSFRERGLL